MFESLIFGFSVMMILILVALLTVIIGLRKQARVLECKIVDHENLNRKYKEIVEKKPENIVRNVAIIPPSNKVETAQYLQQLSMLSSSSWFIHFFESLRREGIEKFAIGKETPDYWRGWLALVGKILDESRSSVPALERLQQETVVKNEV